VDSLKINKYKYVKNMLSNDMVEYLSSWSLKNFTQGDDQVPLSSSHHSKDSEIYKHLV